jgi:hypothetical protein
MADHRKIPIKDVLSSEERFETISLSGMEIQDLVHAVCATLVVGNDRPGVAVILQESRKFGIALWIQVVSHREHLLNGAETKIRNLAELGGMLGHVVLVGLDLRDEWAVLGDVFAVERRQALVVALPSLHHDGRKVGLAILNAQR